jgi:hypothetical protein
MQRMLTVDCGKWDLTDHPKVSCEVFAIDPATHFAERT